MERKMTETRDVPNKNMVKKTGIMSGEMDRDWKEMEAGRNIRTAGDIRNGREKGEMRGRIVDSWMGKTKKREKLQGKETTQRRHGIEGDTTVGRINRKMRERGIEKETARTGVENGTRMKTELEMHTRNERGMGNETSIQTLKGNGNDPMPRSPPEIAIGKEQLAQPMETLAAEPKAKRKTSTTILIDDVN